MIVAEMKNLLGNLPQSMELTVFINGEHFTITKIIAANHGAEILCKAKEQDVEVEYEHLL